MIPVVTSHRLEAFISGRFKQLLLGIVSAGAICSASAQTTAFPGALGFGAYATGGRNGTVYHVTNLNDSGPGSFRDAVSHSGRVIVFDVGGEIKLNSAVSCAGSLTIAGQTAPGGVVFNGGEISFANRNNIICRYIRIRPGSDTASSSDDCLSLYNARNAIFDHVSLEFGPWNNLDAVSSDWQTTPVTDISFQHCIDANPTGQQFGAHTESVSSDWTWCYNIFANSHNRNPLAKVNNVFINNIEYNNSAGYTTHTSTKFKHDIVNNYFVAGPASGGNFPWYQIDNNQSIYFANNLYDSDKNGVLGGGISAPLPGYQGGGTILTSPWSSWTSIIPTMATPLAWRYGISAAGAFPRDEVDSLVISQMQTLGSGTAGTGAGTTGPGGGLYTSQTQTGLSNNGYGTLTGQTGPTDTDGDGMPDYWELATGSDPNIANPLTNTVSGYTLLDNYLNYLAAPHAVTQNNNPVTVNLSQFTRGFAANSSFSVSDATNGTVSLVNGTNALFAPATSFDGLGGFSFTVNDSGYKLTVVVTVCVTPVTPPQSAVDFNGALIGVSITAAPLPANLVWRGDGTANAWNTTSSNWVDGDTLAQFKNNDVVTFDDTGSNTPAITLSSSVAPGTMIFDNTQDYTISGSGSWSGTGSLTKSGSGTLTIGTVNNSYSGTVNINEGTMSLVSGSTVGSGPITISDGGTFNVMGGGSGSTITSPISVPSGSSATIASGQLATSINGAVTTPDTSSTLYVSNSVSFGGSPSSQFSGFKGTVDLVPGSTLRFASSSTGNTFGSLNPGFVVDGTMKPRLAGSTIQLGSISGSGQLTGQEKPPSSGGSGYVTYNIGGNNSDSTFDGTIMDAYSTTNPTCLVKSGTGTLTLTGDNTFTGTNAVAAGTLLLNGSATPLLTTVFSGATLGGNGSITGPVTINSGGSVSPGALGANSIGTLTINGNLNSTTPVMNFDLSSSPVGANDRINMTGTLAMTDVQTFHFNLADNALGAGTYNLIEGATSSSASGVSFADNLPGTTRQTFDIVRPPAGSNPSYVRLIVSGSANALVWRGTNGVNWDTTTVNWNNGSAADTYYNLDAVTFDDTGANSSGVTLVGTLTPGSINVNSSQDYTFGGSGSLAGDGTLTKLGSSTLTIATANNAFTGAINIMNGTITAASGSDLGSGILGLNNAATLKLNDSTSSVFIARDIVVAANQTGTISSDALANGVSGNLASGNNTSILNLSGGVSFSGTTSAQFDNFTGTIDVAPGATLRFSSNSGGNTYGSLSPRWIIDGTFEPRNAGNTIQIGVFSGSGTLQGPQSSSGSGDTLYVIGGDNSDSVFNGIISSNSAVAGSEVAVTKTGSGMLTLNGASTYTGGTTVENGMLQVNNTTGSATGSGDLEIFSGAGLTGSGAVSGATTIDGGAALAPGNGIGTITFGGNLSLNDSSILRFSLGSSSDSVVVNGNLSLTGQLQITNAAGFGPGTYLLFTCSGSIDFGNLTVASAPDGYNYGFDTNTAGIVKLVVAQPIPPVIANPEISNGNFVFSGSGGTPGAMYYVVTSTNVAAPVANWTRIYTNQFDENGNFSVTNPPPTNSQSFYRLQVP